MASKIVVTRQQHNSEDLPLCSKSRLDWWSLRTPRSRGCGANLQNSQVFFRLFRIGVHSWMFDHKIVTGSLL